jgi:alkylation response protein AidB-like acyl-CoA dehydrogenase
MNLSLSDEQEFLREAAQQALARHNTIEHAREALEGGGSVDLWPTTVEAGWAGLLVAEDRGGAGLGAFDAMLVAQECGRRLAPVALLGLLPATALLDAGRWGGLEAVAAGERRAAWTPARPPSDTEPGWTVEGPAGARRAEPPRVDGDRVSGTVWWVPDAPEADVLVVVAVDAEGAPAAIAVEAGGDGVSVERASRYDATRSLGHVTLDGAAGERLEVGEADLARAWYLAQALLAAESVGAVETCLEMALAYAKERFTFGRAIGSYQAVKHGLVEILRRQENARSLLLYAGWAYDSSPEEFPLAASAARSAAGEALDFAARENINVHGGIGATWEHDAPLFFRRAQLSRRLLGGTHDATDRVAAEMLAQADATAEPQA